MQFSILFAFRIPPEGISSQDVTFTSKGSFTIKVEKINASTELVQSGITVVAEFPTGMAAIAAAIAIATTIAAKKTSFFTGNTY